MASKRSRRLSSPRVLNIEDLRRLACKTVPRIVFSYIDGGAEGEVTLRENGRAFEAVTLRPRMAVECSSVDLRTPVLGVDLAMPVLLAPVGYCGVMHPDGEAGQRGPRETREPPTSCRRFRGSASKK